MSLRPSLSNLRKFLFDGIKVNQLKSPTALRFSTSVSNAKGDGTITSQDTLQAQEAKKKSQRYFLSLGQPFFGSHPQAFDSNDHVLPGITKEEFRKRRQDVCNMASEIFLKNMTNKESNIEHIIVVPAASKKYMTENIPYPFRQNSNYMYLTGSYDADAFIVLSVTPANSSHSLFLPDPDPLSEVWDGPRTTRDAAVDHFGVDRSHHTSEFPEFLREMRKGSDNRLVIWCEDRPFIERLFRNNFNFEYRNLQNPRGILDSLRSIKSYGEIELMKKTCTIAAESFKETMKFCRERGENLTEHDIYAKIDYESRIRGAERLAYPPVIASGRRANIIHYIHNCNSCKPSDMVLVDSGCEYFGYCSDITRTWPLSGKFQNDRQQSLYEMILELQMEVLKRVEPGLSLDQLFRIMGILLKKGLLNLGIIDSLHDGAMPDLTLRFCPHHVSHYLGMDVHDTPSVERGEPLQEGMIITIEPGIYIRNSPSQREVLTKVGKEFIGLAIRIEDDVLVTKDGNVVLTADCPKTPSEMESCSIFGAK